MAKFNFNFRFGIFISRSVFELDSSAGSFCFLKCLVQILHDKVILYLVILIVAAVTLFGEACCSDQASGRCICQLCICILSTLLIPKKIAEVNLAVVVRRVNFQKFKYFFIKSINDLVCIRIDSVEPDPILIGRIFHAADGHFIRIVRICVFCNIFGRRMCRRTCGNISNLRSICMSLLGYPTVALTGILHPVLIVLCYHLNVDQPVRRSAIQACLSFGRVFKEGNINLRSDITLAAR